MPLTYSAIGGFFADPGDQAKVTAGMTAALRSETGTIVSHIPAEELAIEVGSRDREPLRRAAARAGGPRAGAREARRVRAAAEICSAIPADVAVGFHSCFGTSTAGRAAVPPISRVRSCSSTSHAMRVDGRSTSCTSRRRDPRTNGTSAHSANWRSAALVSTSERSTMTTAPAASARSSTWCVASSPSSGSRHRVAGTRPERPGKLLGRRWTTAGSPAGDHRRSHPGGQPALSGPRRLPQHRVSFRSWQIAARRAGSRSLTQHFACSPTRT